MARIAEGLAGLFGFLFLIAQFALISGTSMGVVWEHCADIPSSFRGGSVDIDSSWTYIMWPPLPFANFDPPGTCVRNSPLREGLAAVGIWELETPEQQVRTHIERQLAAAR
jgi:hypothetical protein